MCGLNIDDLLAKLEGVRKSGPESWSAKCPAHEDRNPSLSVTQGPDRILCFDHGGCDVSAVLHALGIEFGDLYDEERPHKGAMVVGEYEYRDEQGALLYVVERRLPKDFRQRRPAGGGWGWNLQGVERVPYHLKQLIAGVAGQRVIFVCEGEKDVHSIESLGLVATCNSGGAGKFPASFARFFVGAKVAILPDNDEAGQAHAQAVNDLLAAQARSCRIIDLPGLAAKGDPTDWIKAGGTRDELRKLWEGQGEQGLTLVRASDVTERAVDWLWRPRIAKGKLTILAGNPGKGKSFITCALAATITNGDTFIDADEPCEPGDVLLVNYEDDPEDTTVPRARSVGVKLDRLLLPDLDREGFNLTHLDRLRATLDSEPGIRLVIIDPITSFTAGQVDQNKEAEIRPALLRLKELAHEYHVAMLLVMHLNKSSDMDDVLHRLSGSVAWGGVARSVLLAGRDGVTGRSGLAHIKSNVGMTADTIEYRLADGFEWVGVAPDLTHVELLRRAAQSKDALSKCAEWLQSYLRDELVPVDEVLRAADEQGWSRVLLEAARDELGVWAGVSEGASVWAADAPDRRRRDWAA